MLLKNYCYNTYITKKKKKNPISTRTILLVPLKFLFPLLRNFTDIKFPLHDETSSSVTKKWNKSS